MGFEVAGHLSNSCLYFAVLSCTFMGFSLNKPFKPIRAILMNWGGEGGGCAGRRSLSSVLILNGNRL